MRAYYLNAAKIGDVLETRRLDHSTFAAKLGVSRSHWSTIFNGHRALSKRLRRCLLGSSYLRGIPPDDLWELRDVAERPRPAQNSAQTPSPSLATG